MTIINPYDVMSNWTEPLTPTGLTYMPTRDPRFYRSCILYQLQRSYYYVFGYYLNVNITNEYDVISGWTETRAPQA
jgi:hypothetical protein